MSHTVHAGLRGSTSLVAAHLLLRTVGDVRSRRAFTLLELTAVGAVLLILIAVSVFGFRAVESRVVASRAKTELTQLSASLQGFYTARGYYPTDEATLKAIEPILISTQSALTKTGVISIATTNISGTDVLGLAELDENGQCLLLRVTPDTSSTPTRYTAFQSSNLSCSGSSALSISGVEW
jgi:type II secretory pathway pseudopilin PulG